MDARKAINTLMEHGYVRRHGKGNLTLIPYDEHVFYAKFYLRGYWLASIPQIAVDLVVDGKYGEAGYQLIREWIEK